MRASWPRSGSATSGWSTRHGKEHTIGTEETASTGRLAHRVDRVALFGAVLAFAGLVGLPFVEFRANRIASGVPEAISVAGPVGWLACLIAVAALAAAVVAPRVHRGPVLVGIAVALIVTVAAALGVAAVVLQEGEPPFARVSIGAGAWLAIVGAAVVWFAGWRADTGRGLRWLAVVSAFGGLLAIGVWGGLGELSIAKEYVAQSRRFWPLVGQHLVLAGSGIGFGMLIGIPLGVAASRNRVARDIGIGVVAIIQTIPSMAMLGLLIAPLAALGLRGIGTTPAIVALTLYALLPIVRNTFVGLTGVDSAALDAGRGMGMGAGRLFLGVEVPLALPLVFEGIRAAAVLVIGIAAVTAFIGAGGLGVLVFQGWGQQADDLTLLGAVPMVVLAVAADSLMRALGRAVVSPGIREEAAA